MVRKKQFKNQGEYRTWIVSDQAPRDVPKTPASVYKEHGWKGWADFLGNRHFGKKGRRFKPFREARALARGLKLKGWKEWRAWAAGKKRPKDIPAQPAKIYRGRGWVNVADWLGYRGRFSRARFSSKKSFAPRTLSRHAQLLRNERCQS